MIENLISAIWKEINTDTYPGLVQDSWVAQEKHGTVRVIGTDDKVYKITIKEVNERTQRK